MDLFYVRLIFAYPVAMLTSAWVVQCTGCKCVILDILRRTRNLNTARARGKPLRRRLLRLGLARAADLRTEMRARRLSEMFRGGVRCVIGSRERLEQK